MLICFSTAGILLETVYRNNWQAESVFCRFHICASKQLIERAANRRLEVTPEAAALGWQESREALRRDPAFALRWCDVGESLLGVGEHGQAAYAFRRAVELAPNSPPILLRAANYHWRMEHPDDALRLSSHILELIRDYDAVIFLLYSRSGVPAGELLRRGVPRDAAAAQAFFQSLLAGGTTDAVREAWLWLGSQGYATDRLAASYLDFLLARRLYSDAVETWAAYRRDPSYPGKNRISNGGFEAEFSGARLDWVPSKLEHVREERDGRVAYTGNWSLRLTFDGTTNLNYAGISQVAVLSPGTWRVRARIRVDGITTDRGLSLRVFDPESSSRLDVRTAPVTGSTEWLPVEIAFQVPQATKLVQVQLFREPSWKFDNKIAGTAWVDAVELTPVR